MYVMFSKINMICVVVLVSMLGCTINCVSQFHIRTYLTILLKLSFEIRYENIRCFFLYVFIKIREIRLDRCLIHTIIFLTSISSNVPLRSKNRFLILASLNRFDHSVCAETYWKLPHKIRHSLARVRAIKRFSLVPNNVKPSSGFNAVTMITSFSCPWNEL